MTFSPASPGPAQNRTVTINPAAMPAGTELSFGSFQLTRGQETVFTLIDTGSYTCTSTAPTARSRGVMAIYHGPAGGRK
jgi:hypothetical protein